MTFQRMYPYWIALLGLVSAVACSHSVLAQEPATKQAPAAKPQEQIYQSATLVYEVDPREEEAGFSMDQLIHVLNRRLNPTFFSLPLIKVSATSPTQVTISLGKSTTQRIAETKRKISASGFLEFRVLANYKDHATLIDAAYNVPGNEVLVDGKVVARWVEVNLNQNQLLADREDLFHQKVIEQALATAEIEVELGDGITRALWLPLDLEQIPEYLRKNLVQRKNDKGELQTLVLTDANQEDGGYVLRVSPAGQLQALLVQDQHNLTSAQLSQVHSKVDQYGRFTLSFSFTPAGSKTFAVLTREIKPDSQDFHRRLGIVVDSTLLKAPRLNEPISNGRAEISGNFTAAEINFLVTTLNSGSLPVRLNPTPVSEELVPLKLETTK